MLGISLINSREANRLDLLCANSHLVPVFNLSTKTMNKSAMIVLIVLRLFGLQFELVNCLSSLYLPILIANVTQATL